MPLLDSILKYFRNKPGDVIKQTSEELPKLPMAETPINSITLSPDLSTLYLIDNGRAIAFNLNTKNGVVIGTLNGQLTVATALPVIIPPPKDDDDPPVPPDPDRPGGEVERLIGENPVSKLAERPRLLKISTLRRQFTLMFSPDKGVISIIGASDIDLNIIGASDIDLNIIGASDIDLNVARPLPTDAEPGTEEGQDSTESAVTASEGGCLIYSFLITKKTINIKKAGGLLIVQY